MFRKNKKKILTIFVILIVLAVLYVFAGKILVFIKDVDALKEWLAGFGIFGYLVFILLVSMQVIVAVIPGGVYQIAGGYLYGTIFGSILCLIGCAIGSIIVFLLVRKFGERIIRIFVSEESLEKVKFITESSKCKALLTICFIIPGTPKDVISYIAGLTNISLWHWILICSVGRLPGIWLSVFAGSAFSKNQYGHAFLSFGVLAGICILGMLLYRKIAEKK